MCRIPSGQNWARALLSIFVFAAVSGELAAQNRGNRLLPRYVTVAPPDQAEGARILEEFRQLGLPGDYYLQFVLEVLPRRGERSEIPGQMWGSRNRGGPITRLVLRPPGEAMEQRLLVQNGLEPQAWIWSSGEGSATRVLEVGELLEPLAGSTATVFDLQMPFVHWKEFVFEGVTKVRGRTAHTFLLYPPDEFAAAHPDFGGVRIHLDLQFHALIQAVVLDGANRPRRTLTVLDLKKVGDQWIVKSIDVREESTRDKTRFRVTGAALDLEFAPTLFSPARLAEPLQPPRQVVRIN